MKYVVLATSLVLASCSSTAPTTLERPAVPQYFTVDAATAGRIAGRVTLQGRAPRPGRIRIDEDLACVQLNPKGMLTENLVTGAGGAVMNAFVHVKRGLEGKQFAPPPPAMVVTIDQRNCRFSPRMFGVRAGQTFRVTNSDPLTHNIHPMPRMNRDWNQSQSPGEPALERRFVRPELMVRIKCNVHSWMRAYVNVMEHPYFAVTGEDGAFELPPLPPGEYTLEVLHEQLAPQELSVQVAASARQTVAFKLSGASKP